MTKRYRFKAGDIIVSRTDQQPVLRRQIVEVRQNGYLIRNLGRADGPDNPTCTDNMADPFLAGWRKETAAEHNAAKAIEESPALARPSMPRGCHLCDAVAAELAEFAQRLKARGIDADQIVAIVGTPSAIHPAGWGAVLGSNDKIAFLLKRLAISVAEVGLARAAQDEIGEPVGRA